MSSALLQDEDFQSAMQRVQRDANNYLVTWEGDLLGDFNVFESDNEPSDIAEALLRDLAHKNGQEWLEVFRRCDVAYMRQWCSNGDWSALVASLSLAKKLEQTSANASSASHKKRKNQAEGKDNGSEGERRGGSNDGGGGSTGADHQLLSDGGFRTAMAEVREKANGYLVTWAGDLLGDFYVMEVEDEPSNRVEGLLNGLAKSNGHEWLDAFRTCDVGDMRKWCGNTEWRSLVAALAAAKEAERAAASSSREKKSKTTGVQSTSVAAGGGNSGSWTCEKCTFLNTNPDFLSCEVCGATRPSAARKTESKAVAPKSEAQQQTPVYFYGHAKGKPYACFSQFFPCAFTIDDNKYSHAEQYMMAEKARVMGDEKTRLRILKATTPSQMKALGRKVTPFDPSKWDRHKRDVVFRGNLAKFQQNPGLKSTLLGTGSRTIVEAAKNDRIWGIGLSVSEAESGAKWRGQNLLGKALMQVRDALKEQS